MLNPPPEVLTCHRNSSVHWPRIAWLKVMVMLATCLSGGAQTLQASAVSREPPNIVFIMADDLGWTDLGCTGSRYYETPNIDRLAEQGLKFSSYYVCQNCAPTRAALMSGQYAPRTGIYTVESLERGHEADRKLVPPLNKTQLSLEKTTVAQMLQEAGYATGMFGKWHLGKGAEYHPLQRGFDEAIVASRGHFNFTTIPPTKVTPGQYLADYLTDRAVEFIEARRDERFFLYLPHFAVHTPIQAKPELIARFKDKAPQGGHNNPVYAAMIQSVDESVGRIMEQLDKLGLSDNTLVVFTSDNGGLGGYEVPGTDQTKGITDNAPLRGGKGTLYEGGVRVPLIVRWPTQIEAGATCDEPVVHVDFYPTFLDIAESKTATDFPLDGVSMLPLFRSPTSSLDREAIYFHFPGYLQSYIEEALWRTTPVSTIRAGDWKLMEFLEDGHLELYNLAQDLGERHNLADEKPQQARQLHKQIVQWRNEIGAAMPRPKQ
ncbi:MAG: sulfatase [Planctomycetales bacterium]|nr:sulfatase [Planctomycetales bacterium]